MAATKKLSGSPSVPGNLRPLPASDHVIENLVEPRPSDDPDLVVALDDPGLPALIRERREALGLSLSAMADRAEVSVQTWRNYESGRTTPREDKAPRIWAALGWRLVWPDPWGGLLDGDSDDDFATWMDSFDPHQLSALLGDSPEARDLRSDQFTRELLETAGVSTAKRLPAWDRDPEDCRRSYSPLLADTLGVAGAHTFALGADLLREAMRENLEELAAMPRGTHLGQLEESAILDALPSRWTMRYDFEFVMHLYSQAEDLCDRLVVHPIDAGQPLVRSVAEAMLLQRIFIVGGTVGAAQGHTEAADRMRDWFQALAGTADVDLVDPLFAVNYHPSPDELFHVDHWFDEFDAPFVPDWGAERRAPGHGGGAGHADDDEPEATVTEFPRRRQR